MENKQDPPPQISLRAAQALHKPLRADPEYFNSFSMIPIIFSLFGFIKINPTFNWIGIFILISMIVNRGRDKSLISQAFFVFAISLFLTGFLYYKMAQGFGQ